MRGKRGSEPAREGAAQSVQKSAASRSARIAPINSLRLTHERADSSDPIQPRRRLRLQDFPAGAGGDSGRQRRAEP
ncbi:hypothetical protein C0J26_17500 [Pseudomonas baetica]|nr:hypothetical protein C0J26_17500 [Pseudomonas baetica]